MKGALLLVALLLVNYCYGISFELNHHKRTVKSLKANQWVYPLQGDINQYGEFFMNISIGNPPQVMRVQVDTGSTDLVVFGAGCNGCPKAANVSYYDDTKSKSVQHIGCSNQEYQCGRPCYNSMCPMNIEYGGGGSITGYAEIERIQVGTVVARATMGNIQELNGQFENLGVDGCWGFAYDSLSSWGDMPVVAHICNEHKLYESFSLCLTETNPILDIGTNWQGNSQFQWTPITQQQWYNVEMQDFYINGNSLNISTTWLNWDGVIVDSGTTLVIVSDRIMDALTKVLTSMCDKTPLVGVCNITSNTIFDGYCFPMTDAQVAQFPPISTSLKGMTEQLVMSPQTYLWEGAGEAGVYCLGIQTISGGGLPVILGDVLLQNYHAVFDRAKSMIGFGPLSTCPTPSSTSSTAGSSTDTIMGSSGSAMSSSSGNGISGSGGSGGSSGGDRFVNSVYGKGGKGFAHPIKPKIN